MHLFHTYWDLHCEVLSLMALIGQMMYFQSRSIRTSRYISHYEQNKYIIPWKVFEQFLFFSYDASKNSLFCCIHLFGFFNALQLVNKNHSCALSLDKYLCIVTCTNLNWVTWKVQIGERKETHYSMYSIFNLSYQWQNFSLQYQYNNWQTNNENLKKSIRRLWVDPKPNSLNKHHKNCIADSKKNY